MCLVASVHIALVSFCCPNKIAQTVIPHNTNLLSYIPGGQKSKGNLIEIKSGVDRAVFLLEDGVDSLFPCLS